MAKRITSIVIGIAVSITLERLYGYSFWFSLSLGILALLVIQYGWYFFGVRRSMRREMDELVEKARRGEPLN